MRRVEAPERQLGRAADPRRPEADFLLECCRRVDASDPAGSPAILAGPDWEYLLRLASRHKVLGSLDRGLRNAPAGAVPPEVAARLRSNVEGTVHRNLLLGRELVAILRLFEAAGVPVLPIKGPLWAVAVHDDLASRQFSDLDLLVREADVLRAIELLGTAGIVARNGLTPALWGEYALASEDGLLKVDLHWRLTPTAQRFPLAFDDLWRRRTSFHFLGRDVPHLGTEDLLLVLCLYIGKELWWASLCYLCDLAVLLRESPDANWGEVLRRAEAIGARRVTLLALALTCDLLRVSLPQGVWRDAAEERSVARLVPAVTRRILKDANAVDWYPSHLAKCWWHLRVRERWRDGVRPFLYLPVHAAAPTAKDIEALPLPPRLAFLYWGTRPLLAARRSLRRVGFRRIGTPARKVTAPPAGP